MGRGEGEGQGESRSLAFFFWIVCHSILLELTGESKGSAKKGDDKKA